MSEVKGMNKVMDIRQNSDTRVTREREASVIERFVDIYQSLTADTVDQLDEVYHQKIVFEDPVHKLTGLIAVKQYMKKMYANLTSYQAEITEVVEQNSVAYVNWKLVFNHPKLNSGKSITLKGVSRLEFDDKIFSHIDYFDLGSMLYEQLPLLGAVIRTVKRKAAQ